MFPFFCIFDNFVCCLFRNSDPDLQFRQPDTTKLDVICEDNTYAVFVTYVEIYNNSVYDLLEEVTEDMLRNKLVLL